MEINIYSSPLRVDDIFFLNCKKCVVTKVEMSKSCFHYEFCNPAYKDERVANRIITFNFYHDNIKPNRKGELHIYLDNYQEKIKQSIIRRKGKKNLEI